MWNLLFSVFNIACVIVFIVMSFKYWESHCVLRELLEKTAQVEENTKKQMECNYDVSKANHEDLSKLTESVAELSKLALAATKDCFRCDEGLNRVNDTLKKVKSDIKGLEKKNKHKG